MKKYLTALGVDDKRIRVVTYGEEKPLDWGEGDGAHDRNRRVEFILR